MTYYESAEGIAINVARAYQELDKHGVLKSDRLEFLADMMPLPGTKIDEDGNIVEMQASDVLAWLGY